jgi:superfamily II DNA/RNA helicase
MPKRHSHAVGSELFIVDNSEEEWKALRYLRDWCQLSKAMDIATGYFEIGSLLALDGEWQKVGKIRVLMGDEVSKRSKRAFERGLRDLSRILDNSLEREKEKNHFLSGVPAIVEGIKTGQIECRVYRKDKFHAKAYITHAHMDVIGSSALVGSSNLTVPGLTENVELNVQITGAPVAVLQEWYEEHWEDAEDVTPEILQVIERHTHEYLPFDVYARSLQQYFLGHEQTASEWEENDSAIYPILAKYQRDGYLGLIKRANNFGGAFLCDGVGLGKTFVGLMLIERFILHENKNVALFVPKAAREPVWERELQKRLPEVFKGYSRLKVYSHTDLQRDKLQDELEQVRQQAHVVIIDEAHHFRNTGTKGTENGRVRSRYWRLHDILEGKQVYHLTATPINNSLLDFQHMIELFSRNQADYFAVAPLGIHSLGGHIRQLDNLIERQLFGSEHAESGGEVNFAEAGELLSSDALFDALVVQRSRSYVKESMSREGDGTVLFPEPRKPKVAHYSVKQTYGKLLDQVAEAFNKRDPLFSLPIYYPYAFYKGDDDDINLAFEKGRRKQVVALIRTNFLKRFESSAEAFRKSCWNLLWKLLAWLDVHAETVTERQLVEHWKRRNKRLIGYEPQPDLIEEGEDDLIPEELIDAVEKLDRDDFDIEQIVMETLQDLEQLADFLVELEQFKPSQDKKLRELIKLLKGDPILRKHKVIIFSEFSDTARYLFAQLKAAGIEGLAQIDSGYSGNRATLIQRFSPYYNESAPSELAVEGLEEIRVLISTDVLSEGLNLQDATRLINYDLHWNPVRLMQRIGRVDRRMNADIEERIIRENPDQKQLRGTVGYWNFLPPDELDGLLQLFHRVNHKTLRISKTLGIEGRKLLTEDDDFADLKNFSEQYEGQKTPDEEMHLEYQDLLQAYPGLAERLNGFPNGVFSGKEHIKPNAKAVFFCYARPAFDRKQSEATGEDIWSDEAGDVKWYLFDLDSGQILDDAASIIQYIRSEPKTPRNTAIPMDELSGIHGKIEKHIANTYLRKVQAPVGVKPILRSWMEMN